MQRVHSDQDKPPTAQSGEMMIWTNGKKIVISDNKGNDAVLTFDGHGNITVNITTIRRPQSERDGDFRMTITHQIVNSSALPVPPGVLGQLSGLIGQATALMNAGVGLPGLQAIGSQIASMGSAITAAGGPSGSATDTSSIAGVVTSLGSLMASATSISGMSGTLTSLTGQLSNLTNMLDPAGGMANILHSHTLDAAAGIVHSAFQGQHTVSLGSGGVNLTSSTTVAHTAPTLPHNGLGIFSDALQATGAITGSSFGMLSDRRLKTKIKNHPRVLEKVLKLRLKTFEIKFFNWETGEILAGVKPRLSLGFIAQQFRKIFPQLVRKSGKYLVIEEEKVGPILVAALQEFVIETRAEIKALKDDIAELKQ